MCLKSQTFKPKIADKDIEVYKILRFYNYQKYIAPIVFRDSDVIYEYKKGKNFPIEKNVMPTNYSEYLYTEAEKFASYPYSVSIGWLHAYTNSFVAAVVRGRFAENYYGQDFVIVKMKIPEGSKYFVGRDNDICSNCLVWED